MKNILLTGATSGIGESIKETLLSDNRIFFSGRRILNQDNYFACDLSDIRNCEILFNKAKEYFNGDIDILINCAGVYIYKEIEKMTPDEIDYMINLNLKAPYYLSSLVISDMKKNKYGRIVNIGSISGMVGEGCATLYSATKSALSGLTRALALEAAQYNITVNQINPGWVETPLTDSALSIEDRKDIIDITPQKRFITPKEVANLVKYLISDELKGLTGQNINLCAGLSIGC